MPKPIPVVMEEVPGTAAADSNAASVGAFVFSAEGGTPPASGRPPEPVGLFSRARSDPTRRPRQRISGAGSRPLKCGWREWRVSASNPSRRDQFFYEKKIIK